MPDKWEQYAVNPNQAPATSAPDKWSQFEANSETDQPKPQKGAFRRFIEPALGLPGDLVEHPGAYLNPFSKTYWQKAKEEREAAPKWPNNIPEPHLIPPNWTQAHEDIKSGNYAGAAGDVTSDVFAAAQTLGPFAGEAMSSPGFQRVFPKVGRYAGGAIGYEVGKDIGHPVVGAATGAGIGESVGHGVTALGKRVGPAMTRQGLGSFRAPSPEVLAGPSIAEEPVPSPYRLRGNQIQDAQTVTPRRIVQPRGLLTEGTPDVAAPPEATPSPYRLRGEQIFGAKTATPRQVRPPSLQLGQGEILPPAARTARPPANTEAPVHSQWPPERPSAIQPRQFGGKADILETKGIQEKMREDLEGHGRQAYSQEKRDWFARNVPGKPKGELTAKPGEVGVPGENLRPNASGESPASQEAINRVSSEKTQGVKRFRIDTRSGKEVPLFGVDAVDAKAGPYERIVKRGPNGEEVVDEGPKARPVASTPRVPKSDTEMQDILMRSIRRAKAGD